MCHMFLYCKLLLGNLGFVSVSYLREIAEDDSTLRLFLVGEKLLVLVL